MSLFLAREMAFKALFLLEFNSENSEGREFYDNLAIDAVMNCKDDDDDDDDTLIDDRIYSYFKQLFKGTRDRQDEIDEIISAHLKKGWTIQRLATVDRNVLRISVYEIKFPEKQIPKGIIVNEAVEIAKKYGTDSSGRFVNGILSAIVN